jgi:hypothetical protein
MTNKKQKTVSLSALEAMIKAGELKGFENVDAFLDKYQHHKRAGVSNRHEVWSTPLGRDERQMLIDIISCEGALSTVDQKWGYTAGLAMQKAKNAAIKLVYQNREKLGL